MIDIRLEILGNRTNATCSIWSADGREDTFSEIDSTGAKALTNLIEALRKDHAGQEWRIVGDPTLHGTVPAGRYRKPTISRKKLAALQARWC